MFELEMIKFLDGVKRVVKEDIFVFWEGGGRKGVFALRNKLIQFSDKR